MDWSWGGIITLLGSSALLFYVITLVLNWLGINEGVYGPFILFYVFMVLSIIILPNKIPEA